MKDIDFKIITSIKKRRFIRKKQFKTENLMKYSITIFFCSLIFSSYSQTSDSLLYIRCRNSQTISDSSLTINVISKNNVKKVQKGNVCKNRLAIYIDVKEEGI